MRIRDAAPDAARDAYRRFRKNVLKADVHERVSRVTVSHINRYLHANRHVEGKYVLDAACGSGYGSMLLSAASGYEGVDLDKHAIRSATKEFPEFSYVQGSIYGLPFSAETFDAVVTFETLEHVDQPEVALNEMARVLRPEGVIIGSIPIDHPDRVYHFKPYSAREALAIFESCPLLTTSALYRQNRSVLSRIDSVDDASWTGGALIAHLFKE